ncbi:MAG: YihA family ribosome biogenesis GTP-binding protein [Rickettsiales bacterium]|nr:YihA family ribosome biogenesis GTP-binding protein [Rickettsiales bacterium]
MMKKCEEFFKVNKPKFLFGITDVKQLKEKENVLDFAFVGKSNVGKSSLINAITNSKISISSKTPGRTREINFFSIADKINFVDMPGYGFALATEQQKYEWRKLIYDYISNSKNLNIVFILVDCRKGLGTEDLDFINLLDELKTEYRIVLTKIDCINKNELQNIITKTINELNNRKSANKDVFTISSSKGYGLFELRDFIYQTYLKTKR